MCDPLSFGEMNCMYAIMCDPLSFCHIGTYFALFLCSLVMSMAHTIKFDVGRSLFSHPYFELKYG